MGGTGDLHCEITNGVALITVARPHVHNAISLAVIDELHRLLDTLEHDPSISTVVLTGAGNKTFVSGGDLKDFESLTTREAAQEMSRRMQLAMSRLRHLAVPVIAAVNGDAFGGGCEVALACDLRVLSRRARLSFRQVTIGITPAWGGRQRLVELIGRSRALDLLLTGRTISADEAFRLGLADRLAEPERTVPEALELAAEIAAHPRLAVRAIKRAVNEGSRLEGDAAIEMEASLFSETWVSEDHWEALAALRERRPPRFNRR